MRAFLTVWFGQMVSLLGSSTTEFAIGLWLFTETGSVTTFALTSFFFVLPRALSLPFAGALVDRFDRRTILIASDTAQAVVTLMMGALLYLSLLQPWHIYLGITVMSTAQAFQGPAWSASIPLIVPKEQLGRASGMGRLSEAVSRLASPAMAGALVLAIGLEGIILIDIATYFVAIAALLMVRIPNPPVGLALRGVPGTGTPRSSGKATEKQNILKEVVLGGQYLVGRPGLFAAVLMISLRHLFVNSGLDLVVPMMLTLTNEAVTGTVMSVVASGMLVGTLIMSVWGGPKRRMPLFLAAIMIQGASLFVVGLSPSIVLITAALIARMLCSAFEKTLFGPVVQTKVDLDMQGRVFALMGFLVLILEPVGHAVVGPTVDYVFEPLMTEDGALASILGPFIGVGAGRGMAVVIMLAGVLTALVGLSGFLNPRVRLLEYQLPDVIPDVHPPK